MFDTLTAAERDALRQVMRRGAREAYKLAVFAAPDPTLWRAANGTANDLSAIHEELCGMPGYFTAQAGW